MNSINGLVAPLSVENCYYFSFLSLFSLGMFLAIIILGVFPNLFLDPMRLSLELIITNYEMANAK